MSCPAATVSYQLSFNPAGEQAPPVVVSTDTCGIVEIAARARRLLRLPPETG